MQLTVLLLVAVAVAVAVAAVVGMTGVRQGGCVVEVITIIIIIIMVTVGSKTHAVVVAVDA